MKTELAPSQIEQYRNDGFIVIEDFLNPGELADWRTTVDQAVAERAGHKLPGRMGLTGEDDGLNPDTDYYGKVFAQLINLWQTNAHMKELILDPRIGKMAAELSGESGIRPWHDQALIKQPWGNPTGLHIDTPFWPFSHRAALSIWIALDDATLENGCLFFIPGSHKKTTFEVTPITKNMDAIFDVYPAFRTARAVAAPMKAGSCSFHNGLCIHGAHANMTPGLRRAMTCAFMPDGSTFNGKQNILTDEQFSRLKIGDLMNDESQNPLIYSAV
ncbi:MAG: phytanoyl-CoA dioxygenase family protein [Kiritimatiellales bacterium]|nr:phytanoyl-CoA dioxygenase family protein [Kiritimatiellales bacterium]